MEVISVCAYNECNEFRRGPLALAPSIVSPLSISASSQRNIVEILEARRQQQEAEPIPHTFIKKCLTAPYSSNNKPSTSYDIKKSNSNFDYLSGYSSESLTSGFLPTNSCKIMSSKSSDSFSQQRPFNVFVKNRVFTVDAARLSQLSPIFSLMFCGGEFSATKRKKWDKLTVREIVDEKVEDISEFFECLHSSSPSKLINQWNFPIMLRLSHKYQVKNVRHLCAQFIDNADLSIVKADQVLTLLLAALDFSLRRSAVGCLVLRLAEEELQMLTRLKINRFLPVNIYQSLLATNFNVRRIRECSQMNGHVFRLSDGRIQTLRTPTICDICNHIVESSAETARCIECHKTLCRNHWQSKACTSDYGVCMLKELRVNLLELKYDDEQDSDSENVK